MMWFLLLLALPVILFIKLKFRNAAQWYHYLIPVGASLFGIGIGYATIAINEHSRTSDQEVLSYIGHKVQYYEAWNEYVYKTCTETCCCDSKGQNCSTRTYDCSYVQEHPEYWVLVYQTTVKGKTITDKMRISRSQWQQISQRFATNPRFVELNRNSYSRDGDLYEVYWNGDPEKALPVSVLGTYENRIQSSHSIYNYPDVPEHKTHQLHKYNYRQLSTGGFGQEPTFRSNPVFGDRNRQFIDFSKKLEYLNALYGGPHQIRMNLLLYWNKPSEIAELQERYWKGGNKNELNICVGLDDTLGVKWVRIISWGTNKTYHAELRDFVLDMKKFNPNGLLAYLTRTVPIHWKRKQFHDFDYISIEPPFWTYLVGLIFTIGALIGSFYLTHYLVSIRNHKRKRSWLR